MVAWKKSMQRCVMTSDAHRLVVFQFLASWLMALVGMMP
jgi:hypothetical protein